MTERLVILDTTLRDGEQSPGAHMHTDEKLDVCRQLLRLKVDVIEAGFPASSPGDFQSVRVIGSEVGERAVVCALSRAVPSDIEACAEALQTAARPRIHTGIGVSPQHLKDKLHLGEDAALERAVAAVRLARRLCDDVEFYAEDAARADLDFLARIVQAVVAAGATTVNIPDTTGFSLPQAYGARIAYLMEHVRGIEDVVVSVHCHNDLGMATALSLAGVAAGARQVECTVNGIGERAGNTSLEEVVMAVRLHGAELGVHTGVDTTQLARASRLVSAVTGIPVQPNKAIVGANAFAHASGIHQDGVIKAPSTYEIIDPAEVGVGASSLVLTARSGRAALRRRLKKLGYTLEGEAFDEVYALFLQTADRKKEVYDEDLTSLMQERGRVAEAFYTLRQVQVSCGYPLTPTATVILRDREGADHVSSAIGGGPVDAVYKAISDIVGVEGDLSEFSIQSITRGTDALGEVTIRILADDGTLFTGRGSDPDIIVSTARAYLNALNRLLSARSSTQS